MDEDFRKAALDYHRLPRPGKARDRGDQADGDPARSRARLFAGRRGRLRGDQGRPRRRARLHRPGQPCRGISNGTAVLGLGNIGALAGKPVMEGKAVLFKKFAGIDVFDIEVDAADPDASATSSPRSNPPSARSTWKTSRRPNASPWSPSARAHGDPGVPRRPARHRHHRRRRGAQRPAAAGQGLDEVKLVTSGAGAAALACVDLLVEHGAAAGERHADRHQGRRLCRAADGMDAQHGALRPGNRGADPARTRWPAPTCSSACPRRAC